MKIIGTTESGFLVEMTDGELCNLMGIEGGYEAINKAPAILKAKESNPSKNSPNKKIDWVGLTIPVSSLYASARALAVGWNEKYEFKNAIQFLDQFKRTLEILGGTYLPLKEKTKV